MSLCQICLTREAQVAHTETGRRACEPCALVGPDMQGTLSSVDAKAVEALIGSQRCDSLVAMRRGLEAALRSSNPQGVSQTEYNAFGEALLRVLKGDCGVASMPLVNLRWGKRVNAALAVEAALGMAREFSDVYAANKPYDDKMQNAAADVVVKMHADALMAALRPHCGGYWARAMLADTFGPIGRMSPYVPLGVRDQIGAPALQFAEDGGAEDIGDELEDIGRRRWQRNTASAGRLTGALLALAYYQPRAFGAPSYTALQQQVAQQLVARFGAAGAQIVPALDGALAAIGRAMAVRPKGATPAPQTPQAIVDTLVAAFSKLFEGVVRGRDGARKLANRMNKTFNKLAEQVGSQRAADLMRDLLQVIRQAFTYSAGRYGAPGPMAAPYRPALSYMRNEIGGDADAAALDMEDIGAEVDDIDASLFQRARSAFQRPKAAVQRRVYGYNYNTAVLLEQLMALSALVLRDAGAGSELASAAKSLAQRVAFGTGETLGTKRIDRSDAAKFYATRAMDFTAGGTPTSRQTATMTKEQFARKMDRKYGEFALADQFANLYLYTLSGQSATKETSAQDARVVADLQSVYRNLVRGLREVTGVSADYVAQTVMRSLLDEISAYLREDDSGAPVPPPRE